MSWYLCTRYSTHVFEQWLRLMLMYDSNHRGGEMTADRPVCFEFLQTILNTKVNTLAIRFSSIIMAVQYIVAAGIIRGDWTTFILYLSRGKSKPLQNCSSRSKSKLVNKIPIHNCFDVIINKQTCLNCE